MEETAVSVYSEAKGEYTKQLTLFLVPAFHRFFMACLTQASQEEPQVKRQLWKFQELLSQVPEWNIDKVQRETAKLLSEIQCDYMEELVTAVFIAHTKVLTAIRIGNKNKRVQITIPKLDHFLHRSLSECARLLWTSAYLFHNEASPIEKQKNHRQIEQLLHEGIAQAIRGLLPVKNILKDYLAEPEAEEEDDADDEAETSGKQVAEPSEQPEAPVKQEAEVEAVPETPEKPAVTETPIAESIVEPIAIETEVPALPTPEVPAPVPPSPVTPTLVVQTAPTVQFTDYNQIIQESGNQTKISYEHTDHEPPSEEVEFADDQGEPLDEFEVLEGEAEPLGGDDFETL